MKPALGRYAAVLFAWEPDSNSGANRAYVDISRDGRPYAQMTLALDGAAIVAVKSGVKLSPGETAADRTMRALTLVLREATRSAVLHGDALPDSATFSEEQIASATDYAGSGQPLEVSFEAGAVLWERNVEG